MNFEIEFKDTALKDTQRHMKSGQKKLVNKIRVFTLECQDNPRIGTL